MSVVYRERDREWDTRSAGGRTVVYRDSDREREGYSVKKIYRIPNRDREVEEERISIRRDDDDYHHRYRDREFDETRVIRRARTPEPETERREIRIIREDRSPVREVISPPPRREVVYERDYDRLGPDRGAYGGDLRRYSRSVEYFQRPEPQPIIIRQEPQQIIIQQEPQRAPLVVPERKEELDLAMIKRTDIDETKSVSRRTNKSDHRSDNGGGGDDEEEEYYYERRRREVGRDDDRHHHRHHHRDRDLSPGDSVSQAGRDRDRSRRYSSDSSFERVEKRVIDGSDVDQDTHHKKHLLEGAIAGAGAAELLRHHNKKKGEATGGGLGRVGKDVGGAALGAIAVEGVSRARSAYRSYSRRRNGSGSRSGGSRASRHRRHRGRGRSNSSGGSSGGGSNRSRSGSRKRSKSRTRHIAEIGLGAAAVAAAAAYANRQRKKSNANLQNAQALIPAGQSPIPQPDDPASARNPSHRNKKVATAGLAGAAVAALVEHWRNNKRKEEGEKPISKFREGLPVAAAGLGSAAIAGLYEHNKAKREAKMDKEIRKEQRAARRAERAQEQEAYDQGLARDGGAPAAIDYPEGPGYNNNGIDYYNNAPMNQQGGFYGPDGAMVPAAAAGAGVAGAGYGAATQGQQPRERQYSSESDSERERRRRRRHRRHRSDSGSRSPDRVREDVTAAAAGAAAAGAGAYAANEYDRQKQQRREERRERKRREAAEREAYGGAQEGYPPPGAAAGEDPYASGQQQQQQQYGAPHQGEYTTPGQSSYPAAQGYVPPEPAAYSPPPGAPPYHAGTQGPHRNDENVSEPNHPTTTHDSAHVSLQAFVEDEDRSTPGVPEKWHAAVYETDGAHFYHGPAVEAGNATSDGSAGAGLGVEEGITNDETREVDAAGVGRPRLERRATSQPAPRTTRVRFTLDTDTDPPEESGGAAGAIVSTSANTTTPAAASATIPTVPGAVLTTAHQRSSSPASSASTIDLPARFDGDGRPLQRQRSHSLDARDNTLHDEVFGGPQRGGTLSSLLRRWSRSGRSRPTHDPDRDSERDSDYTNDQHTKRRRSVQTTPDRSQYSGGSPVGEEAGEERRGRRR